VLFDEVKQFDDGKAKRVRDDLDDIERRIRAPILNAAQVCLIDAAALSELHLAHASLLAQNADTRTELLTQRELHAQNYLDYALIRINTYSYICRADSNRSSSESLSGDGMAGPKESTTAAAVKARMAAAKQHAADVTPTKPLSPKPPPVVELISVYCPKCGLGFLHKKTTTGKAVGGFGGAAAGAAIGAQIGIAAGPLGAFAGTIPGAILGAMFGTSKGSKLDRATCERCKTAFDVP
jgi:hypothetical protein